MISVGSTFSGIEGIGLAAEQTGRFRVAWQCENDLDAQATLRHHYPNIPLYGDIAEIGYSAHAQHNVEPVDVLAGGFPCQDVSVAGRRRGLAGSRTGLFYEFARVADEIAPTWIVLENVPGLLSSNEGRDMGAVVGTLEDLGYGVAWRVLDAQHFGVPQRRRRVVIVGHFGDGASAGTVLFEPEGSGRDIDASRTERSTVAALTAHGVGTCGADDNQAPAGHIGDDVTSCERRTVSALTARAGPTFDDQQTGQLIAFPVAIRGRDGGSTAELGTVPLSNALRASQGGGDKAHILTGPAAFHPTQDPISSEGVTHTLSSGNKQGVATVAVSTPDMAVRRLTPTECERLQGFPDGWTDTLNSRGKPTADSGRYKRLGNAVAVPVFRWVFDRLGRVDNGEL